MIHDTVPKELIELVLARKLKYINLRLDPEPDWNNSFIVELLRWYDQKVELIPMRKRNDHEQWRQFYEQIVRSLYFAVVEHSLHKISELKIYFRYFFYIEDDDPYRNDYDMISPEKLIKVYNYITKKLSKRLQLTRNNCDSLGKQFIGMYDTFLRQDEEEHLVMHFQMDEQGNSTLVGMEYNDDNEEEMYCTPSECEGDEDEDMSESDSDSEYTPSDNYSSESEQEEDEEEKNIKVYLPVDNINEVSPEFQAFLGKFIEEAKKLLYNNN